MNTFIFTQQRDKWIWYPGYSYKKKTMEIKYRTQLGELLDYFGLKGAAVEIGVAEGRNAQSLIAQSAITRLFLVDAWKSLNQKGDGGFPQEWHDNNLREVHERIEPFKQKATILQGLSVNSIRLIEDNSLVLAYIDGDHSYIGALNDFKEVWSKIQPGGILAGHDYLNPVYGVRRAVWDFIEEFKDQIVDCEIHVIEEDDESMAGFWLRKKI